MCDEVQKRRHEDAANSNETLHEFKKARYSWQVKGRCEDRSGHSSASSGAFTPASDVPQGCDAKTSSNGAAMPQGYEAKSIVAMTTETATDLCNLDKNFGAFNSLSHSSDADISANAMTASTTLKDDKCIETPRQSQSNPNSLLYDNPLSTMGHSSGLDRNSSSSRRGIHINFDTTNFQRPPVNFASYIWQKQEVGCAIVDNVFNKTLEEMGLSPDPKVNLLATTRLTVENRSIEAAISQQGLIIQRDHNSPSQLPASVSCNGNEITRSVQGKEANYRAIAINDTCHPDHGSKPEQNLQTAPSANNLSIIDTDQISVNQEIEETPSDCDSETIKGSLKLEDDVCPMEDIARDSKLLNTCDPNRHILNQSESKMLQTNCETSETVFESNPEICGDVDSSSNNIIAEVNESPDGVLDLAVSTALLSHGLMLSDTCNI